jgi:hypothetical protein
VRLVNTGKWESVAVLLLALIIDAAYPIYKASFGIM